MLYYRVALRSSQSATWRWKSSPLTLLDGVLGVLKLYNCMPREHIRVFLSTSPEQMETMLGRENQGLLSTCTGYLAHPFEKEVPWAFTALLFLMVKWVSANDRGGESSSFRRETTGVWTTNHQGRHAQAP